MIDQLDRFPMLFGKTWRARGLDTDIAALNLSALAAEYRGFRKVAPKRPLRGKRYLVEHAESTNGGKTSNRKEERLARDLHRRAACWHWPGGKWFRLLDYQVPLKAQQDDARIGKIDLLGVTDVGQLLVVELKVGNASGSYRSDPPPAALMEALRYSAIVEENLSIIAGEANAKCGVQASPTMPPAVLILGTEGWWRSWLNLSAAGLWATGFLGLLAGVEEHLRVTTRCLAIVEGPPGSDEKHMVKVDFNQTVARS